MIYFDNAATGGFKPNSVIDSACSVIKYLSANPGRSGHRLSITGAETIYKCRSAIADLFNGTAERVVFTKNCTEALNLAIFGTLKVGGHIITTVFEHNSVIRPLISLKQKGLIELDIVCPSKDGIVHAIEEKIKPNTYLVVTTAISNVNGEGLPINQIGSLCRKNGVLYLLDGAQAGGHITIDIKKDMINMLALAGHKGLYGIMGSGALVFDQDVNILPLIYGGTGSESFNLNQPTNYPESLESGTLNLPAIASLLEGVNLIKNNINNFSNHLFSYTQKAIEGLSSCSKVKCYSKPNKAGIVAFRIDELSSEVVADKLNYEFDIAVRGGLHCAPLMHEFLKTKEEGLVRISFAVQNTTREIDYFIKAIKTIAQC